MKDSIHTYVESLIKERSPLFQEMEHYAQENGVPIMELAGIEVLLQLISMQKPCKILEIGTAIGYSAMRMADVLTDVQIVTIERDDERYEQAIKNIKQSQYGNKINVLKGDALEIIEEVKKFGPFDAIFIDAAKGQYMKFFELYTPFLTKDGYVYTDNVLFKGLVAEENIENKRIRNLVGKIKKYNEWLVNHEDYLTTIIPVGDGLAVSRKTK
ncbi:O-methyltransferase [Heyndrickxia oleronia]|uniref:tRNA 5-hydroxyuridine methyltransferase n=1 Tax=Heyndrickxia oleronia TaxID=38875 RepID=A0A8E2I9W3_9BACI|nr:O-methyltransferase [Heyndrickxia oleronia]MEC1376744.1 O-methyltransferase [Heyndrickxia oleronia]OOP66091.1 SAM-dependent methyltransferase [Heyndrickxia oleronia]